MKSLALYIDKWYIVGAFCVDGNIRPVILPNNEDRIWLFFHEDTNNDTISYGKGFKSHYWDKENHYYGDVFSKLTNSEEKFVIFKHSQPIKDIFKMGKVFDDLKNFVDNEEYIPTYLSFSSDISSSARFIFIEELKCEGFDVKESVARIDHLALEYAVKKNGFSKEGHYLVLNACNENLHYSIYKRSGDIFLRLAEDFLRGKGTDLRSRCLVEYVVDRINQTEHFLKTSEDSETEYLRCLQYVDEWILKLSTSNFHIPIQLTDVTLSKDPYKTYSVSVKRKQIDEKTELITKNIVDYVVRFVRESGIRHEEISGIVFIGNTFTNKQFSSQFLNHYTLKENKMICYMDKDLSMLVSAYSFIDCSQFSELESKFTTNAEDELKRIKIAEEEKIATKKAEEEATAEAKILQAKKEEETKFRQAMDRGYESESNHDYENMVEFFEIAKNLRPNDEEASGKYNDALRLKAEQIVTLKNFKQKLQQAKTAFDEKDWDVAKQKAEEALSFDSSSAEARHIKNEANRQIVQCKNFDRYIDRADLFIAQKLYNEASEELEKARLLSIDDKAVTARFNKINSLIEAFKSKLDNLTSQLDAALNNEDYDKALLVCEDLIENDHQNQTKWTNKISEIKTTQKENKIREERICTLKLEIDSAQWNDDWQMVVDKCRQLIEISPNDKDIQKKLEVADAKLKTIQVQKAIEKSIAEVNDLIVRAEFESATDKLNLISRMSDELDFQRQVKDLRKLIFTREEEFNTTKKIKQNPNFFGKEKHDSDFKKEKPRRPIGFNVAVQEPKVHKDSFFDDDTSFSKRKSNQSSHRLSAPKKTKEELGHDNFFDCVNTKDKSSSSKKYTLDDFDF